MKTTSKNRPGSPARFLVSLSLLVLLTLLLAACTRDRPAPEQTTPTPSADAAPAVSTPLPPAAPPSEASGDEPEVEVSAVDAASEITGTAGTGTPEIRDYEVQPGDTLLSIALTNDVSAERLKEINFLQSDLIQVGQILQVPMLPPTPTPEPVPFYHEVKPGESLGIIAALYDVSWKDLVAANGLEDANALQAGRKLIIPGYSPEGNATSDPASEPGAAESSAPASQGGNAVHKVRAGETLSQIAQMYGVTTAQIVAANNLTSRNIIKPGQELVIPGVSPSDAERARSVRHTVAVGESVSQIAREYGVEISAIVRANGLPNADSVYVGQVLVIPSADE